MIETTHRTLADWHALNAATQRQPAPTKPTKRHPTLRAVVNHGRWVVHCPTCPVALPGNPNDARFWCVECFNVEHGGAWLDVAYPDAAEREACEAELVKRRRVENRNWTPGAEDLALLIGENIAHGADV